MKIASQLTSWHIWVIWELDTERLQVSWLVPALGEYVRPLQSDGWTQRNPPQRTQKKVNVNKVILERKHGWNGLRTAEHIDETTELLGSHASLHLSTQASIYPGTCPNNETRCAMNSQNFTLSTRRIRKGYHGLPWISSKQIHTEPGDTWWISNTAVTMVTMVDLLRSMGSPELPQNVTSIKNSAMQCTARPTRRSPFRVTKRLSGRWLLDKTLNSGASFWIPPRKSMAMDGLYAKLSSKQIQNPTKGCWFTHERSQNANGVDLQSLARLQSDMLLTTKSAEEFPMLLFKQISTSLSKESVSQMFCKRRVSLSLAGFCRTARDLWSYLLVRR